MEAKTAAQDAFLLIYSVRNALLESFLTFFELVIC